MFTQRFTQENLKKSNVAYLFKSPKDTIPIDELVEENYEGS